MKRQLLLFSALYLILSSTILLAQNSMSTEETKFLELILAERCHDKCDMAIAGITEVPPIFKKSGAYENSRDSNEIVAFEKQHLRKQLIVKGYQVDNLTDVFFLRLRKSGKILLPSSPRLGYLIDHDGKYEKYFSLGGEGYEKWSRGKLSSPREWAHVSVPVYDPKTGIILIYVRANRGLLAGEGHIIAYKLKDGAVEEIGRIQVWIAVVM